MYAPVDYDRSLYLFCCNKRVCSITSEGWTVCRNQQTANSSSSQKKVNPPIIAEVAPILKVAAAPSVWGSLLEGDNDDDADMMLMLAARDAALASKKTETNKKIETKSVPRKEKQSAVCQADESVLSTLLRQALLCWKVEAVSDPCPYGADVLIHAALRGGDDEEDEVRSALSSVTMQHVQQMLAGYIAAAETEVVEGGEDQGRDDPALIDLLKKEVLAGSAANVTKEERAGETVAAIPVKMKQTKSSNDRKRDAGKAKDKEEDKAVTGDTEKEEDAAPISSDCLSRVEGAFQAAVSHATSQVVRFAYGGYPLWCTYPPPRAAAAVPLCACGAERVFEMQLMPGTSCHNAYMHAS